MKVICSPDSFKDSLTAREAGEAMMRGVTKAAENANQSILVDLCPISDGGEGFVDAMLTAAASQENVETKLMTSTVTGPRKAPVHARWGLIESVEPTGNAMRTAVIEMSSASGLELLSPEQRDPTQTTTFGTGELIRHAIESGADEVLLGIGGSATTDAGCGMAQALGVTFYDEGHHTIQSPITGGELDSIKDFELSASSNRPRITVACDVTNPLTGLQGAAHVYGPQKGATPDQVDELDQSLRHIAKLVEQHPSIHVDHEQTPGAGAAGGIGFGLLVFVNATLIRGIDMVLEAVDFESRVKTADICLTGEGKLDNQSLAGKACIGVATLAEKHHVPAIALVGTTGQGAEEALNHGLADYVVIGEGLHEEDSIARAAVLLERAAERVVTRYL